MGGLPSYTLLNLQNVLFSHQLRAGCFSTSEQKRNKHTHACTHRQTHTHAHTHTHTHTQLFLSDDVRPIHPVWRSLLHRGPLEPAAPLSFSHSDARMSTCKHPQTHCPLLSSQLQLVLHSSSLKNLGIMDESACLPLSSTHTPQLFS